MELLSSLSHTHTELIIKHSLESVSEKPWRTPEAAQNRPGVGQPHCQHHESFWVPPGLCSQCSNLPLPAPQWEEMKRAWALSPLLSQCHSPLDIRRNFGCQKEFLHSKSWQGLPREVVESPTLRCSSNDWA